MCKLEIVETQDGSKTLFDPKVGDHFHSLHGAQQESEHVFVAKGLQYFHQENPSKQGISILEIGFGSGLNMVACLKFSSLHPQTQFSYTGMDNRILSRAILEKMGRQNSKEILRAFKKPGDFENVSPNFCFSFQEIDILQSPWPQHSADLIFFDAFGPRHQDEMWSAAVLRQCYDQLNVGGMLISYCSQGAFKRNLKACGFTCFHPEGPKGKREMTRAKKN